MRANVTSNQWLYFNHLTEPEEDMLWEEFSVSLPNVHIDPDQLGQWDGVYRKYNRAKKRIARPLLSMLRGLCRKHDIPLVVKDHREKWEYSPIAPDKVTEDFLSGIKLHDYQVKSIKQACLIECGVYDIPTGGGKGEIICGICKAIECPTVIIADQTVVVTQLKQRLELRDVAEEVGIFYAGRRPNGELIVVGLIQSLGSPGMPPQPPNQEEGEPKEKFEKRLKKWESQLQAFQTRKKNAKELRKYVKEAEMIIIDECDKATSDQFKMLFRHWFKGRRRYGFSGTPFDPEKPVEAMVMQEHLGSPIMIVPRRRLEKIGQIIPCEYFSMGFGIDGDIHEGSAYDIAYEEWMTENRDFHKLIAALCNRYKGDGTLILVDKIALGKHLEKIIRDSGLSTSFIYGQTTKRRRDEMLRAFERRELDVLIGGKIINRGLDLSGGCENLVIATGGKLESDFVQKIGRAVRRNRLGRSRVFDFYFRCNKYLYDHSKARLRAMVNAGYRTTIVFPGGSIDGEKLIKRRYVVPKRLFKRTRQKQLIAVAD